MCRYTEVPSATLCSLLIQGYFGFGRTVFLDLFSWTLPVTEAIWWWQTQLLRSQNEQEWCCWEPNHDLQTWARRGHHNQGVLLSLAQTRREREQKALGVAGISSVPSPYPSEKIHHVLNQSICRHNCYSEKNESYIFMCLVLQPVRSLAFILPAGSCFSQLCGKIILTMCFLFSCEPAKGLIVESDFFFISAFFSL